MDLLKHTIEKSNFYRELYKNIDIDSFQSIEDLKRLPIVTKEMLLQNIDDVVTIEKSNAVEGHTGGTTGKSLIVYFTPEDIQKRMATLDHFKMQHGFENMKMKRATFMGKHIVHQGKKRKNSGVIMLLLKKWFIPHFILQNKTFLIILKV